MLGRIETPRSAFDLVKAKCPVNAFPKVAVFDRCHLAESLPLKAVLPPILKSVPKASRHIAAGRDQRDTRWLIQGFQSPHHGQQIQPLAGNQLRFLVLNLHLGRAIDRFQHKSPLGH